MYSAGEFNRLIVVHQVYLSEVKTLRPKGHLERGRSVPGPLRAGHVPLTRPCVCTSPASAVMPTRDCHSTRLAVKAYCMSTVPARSNVPLTVVWAMEVSRSKRRTCTCWALTSRSTYEGCRAISRTRE